MIGYTAAALKAHPGFNPAHNPAGRVRWKSKVPVPGQEDKFPQVSQEITMRGPRNPSRWVPHTGEAECLRRRIMNLVQCGSGVMETTSYSFLKTPLVVHVDAWPGAVVTPRDPDHTLREGTSRQVSRQEARANTKADQQRMRAYIRAERQKTLRARVRTRKQKEASK